MRGGFVEWIKDREIEKLRSIIGMKGEESRHAGIDANRSRRLKLRISSLISKPCILKRESLNLLPNNVMNLCSSFKT